jgi:hypothetical protein
MAHPHWHLIAYKWLLIQLSPLQNICLRAITGAYKALCFLRLDIKVRVPLLGITQASLQAEFKWRLETSEVQEVIKIAMERVWGTLGGWRTKEPNAGWLGKKIGGR